MFQLRAQIHLGRGFRRVVDMFSSPCDLVEEAERRLENDEEPTAESVVYYIIFYLTSH